MSLNRIAHVSRTPGRMWSTTRAGPPTVHRAGPPQHPRQRRAETAPLQKTWRTQQNRFLCPLPCGYLERGIAHRLTVLLAILQVALQDVLIRPGLPVRVGKVSLARTVSSTSARYPSYRARPAGSMAK